MLDIKQRLLIQELAKVGFPDAQYKPETDNINIRPDNARMSVIYDNGDIHYASEHRGLVTETIKPLVDRVNEVTAAWEKAQPIPIDGVSNFRLLNEYNNIVLAARDDTEKGYGMHYVTWEYNRDYTAVNHGHYTQDYNFAKEDFAVRSGMMPADKVFTTEQAAEIKTVIQDLFENDYDLYLTYEKEEILQTILDKINAAYPTVKEGIEKSEPGEEHSAMDLMLEQAVTDEQENNLYQLLINKIDAEMDNYTDYIMEMDRREIFGMATDIAMREEVVWSIKNNDYDFDDNSLEFLLGYDGLLTEAAGNLKNSVLDGFSTNGDVGDIINNILVQQYENNEKVLDDYLPENESEQNAAPEINSPSPDIHEATERQLDLKEWLNDMMEDTLSDAVEQCMRSEKSEIINMAGKLAAMEDVKNFFDDNNILLKQDEYEYLVMYHNPLEIIADRWHEQSRDTSGILSAVRDILDKRDIGNSYKFAYHVAPNEIQPLPENTKKPSILADLAEKLKEIKPTTSENTKKREHIDL